MHHWTAKDLNTEQAEAITAAGSVLLVACPGSGKTRALIHKIALELSNLNDSRMFVVAITYTNVAANEIRERVENLGINTNQLWIGTIHAFCLDWIIRPYKIYEPKLSSGFRVIDSFEQEIIISEACQQYAGSRIAHWDCNYHYTSSGIKLSCQNSDKIPDVKIVLKEYFALLLENKQIDYEQILFYACRLIHRIHPISYLLSQLFKLVLIDEYQDTKELQYLIVAKILKTGENRTKLFMVGDPNQSIYSSLGGYPIDIHEIRKLTNTRIEKYKLVQNYRSSASIIEYFSKFKIGHDDIESDGVISEYPSLITYNTTVSQDNLVEEIARLISYNIKVLDIPPTEICVIAPQWVPLAATTRRLISRLPEYKFNGPGTAPFSRDIENFWYKLTRIALSEPSPKLYVRRIRWAQEVINDLTSIGADTHHYTPRLLLKECNSIQINESIGLDYLNEFFNLLFDKLGITIRQYSHLRDSQIAFFESSKARIQKLESEGIEGVCETEYFKNVFKKRKGITLSTIHGAKGAEFDVVIAHSLLEAMVPHFNDPAGNESAAKLLYVICSRARKNLHLISETDRQRRRDETYHPTLLLNSLQFNYDDIPTDYETPAN